MRTRIKHALLAVLLFASLLATVLTVSGTAHGASLKTASGLVPLHIECQYTAWYSVASSGPVVWYSQYDDTVTLYAKLDTTDRGYCGSLYAHMAWSLGVGCRTYETQVFLYSNGNGYPVGTKGSVYSCAASGGVSSATYGTSSGQYFADDWVNTYPTNEHNSGIPWTV